MRSILRRTFWRTLRRTTTILLLAIFLAPGLLQARSLARPLVDEGTPVPGLSFFTMVWNLLEKLAGNSLAGGDGTFKNGGQTDPSGGSGTAGNGATSTGEGDDGDNGGQTDPSG